MSDLRIRSVTVVDEIGRRLAPAGWAPAEDWDEDDFVAFIRRHDADISFELGLSTTPRSWGLSLNPTLGVRHAVVDRLSADFLGGLPGACMTGTTFLDLLWSAQPRDGIGERWMVDRAAGPVAVADVADRARQALAAVARKAETQPVLVRGDSDRFIEYFRAHFGVAP